MSESEMKGSNIFMAFINRMDKRVTGVAFIAFILLILFKSQPGSSDQSFSDTYFLVSSIPFLFLAGFIAVLIITDRPTSDTTKDNPGIIQPIEKTFRTVEDIYNHLLGVIEKVSEDSPGSIELLNYGLDLETVMPKIRFQFTTNKKISNLKYRGLIINPDSDRIKPMIGKPGSITKDNVIRSIASYVELKNNDNLKKKDLSLQLKQYDLPPIFHGFLVNQTHLYLGFTEIVDNKISGGEFPYRLYTYKNDCDLTKHYFKLFQTWFKHTWENSSEL